ncbi:lipocalin family protein [Sphingobacterium hotanense]|uniref:lipocalin family protein n=1 Tax=Sphingobacterium hotanense TaxID=649196 RepID=UPI0021A3BA49|nr:lipocalin family protein [Sphingobacterium hotanense]MCT1525102.1 lipocalin family protein [Sphingobacterium hotanense]
MSHTDLKSYLLGKWNLSFRGSQIAGKIEADFHAECEGKTYYQFNEDQTGSDKFYIYSDGSCEEQPSSDFSWDLRDNILVRNESISEEDFVAVAEYEVYPIDENEMEWRIQILSDDEEEEQLFMMKWRRAE